MAQPPEGQMEFHVDVFQIPADAVLHFGVFELSPSPLDGIQVGCIRRKEFEVDSLPWNVAKEFADRGATMNRRSVPDHQPAVAIAENVVQKGDGMDFGQGLLTGERVQVTIHRHASHDRKVVPSLPVVQDGCQPRGA